MTHGIPAYPLRVSFAGGRVRHAARQVGTGPYVVTLCRKRSVPNGDGSKLSYCRACAGRPNPIPQQGSMPKA